MNLYNRKYIGVIDTETNYFDEVISIGVVVADSVSFLPVDKLYLIIDPEYRKPAMFSFVLEHDRACIDGVLSRKNAIGKIIEFLNRYEVDSLFAYNANFDKSHLPEMRSFKWYDIMRIAAYRQYNKKIPVYCECYKTGKMKCGYRAEDIYQMLSGDRCYCEIHNAVTDAEDELEIMRLLEQKIDVYEIAKCKK